MDPATAKEATTKVGGNPPGSTPENAAGRGPMWRRVAPAVGLFFLAPLVAEFLLGNVPIREISALLFLAPMYGGGALLIREVARRAGRGWSTIILLALAYGVLEPSLLDHSLFNPSFQGHDLRGATYIPALGTSAYNALGFAAGHAIWSISVPIAIVETFVPGRRTMPWLGKIGLTLTGIVFLVGCALIFNWAWQTQQFLPSAPQMVSVTIMVVALIVAAFTVGRTSLQNIDRIAPNPWLVGAVAFVASSLFFDLRESWPWVAFGLLLIATMTGLIWRWSRGAGWGAAHRLALAGGALLTYAWGGFQMTVALGRTETSYFVGQAILDVGAIFLLAAALHTVRKSKG